MAKYKKRADGRYQAQINLGRKPNGKYLRKTIYADTIRELENKIQAVKAELNNGIMPGESSKITFELLSDIWVNKFTPNVSKQGRSQYFSLFRNYINPAFGALHLKDIRKANLQSLLNDMAQNGASQSQLKKIKMLSSAVMEFATDNEYIARNVFASVKVPVTDQKERQPLTKEQMQLVITTWQEHRMGLPALIMLYCGLRRGELLALQWSDINLDTGKINIYKSVAFDNSHKPVIKTTKTKSGQRQVEIPFVLLSAFNQSKPTSLYVCSDTNGNMMTYSAFKRAWESYMHYLNICAGGTDATRSKPKVIAMQPFTPHQLRHTYATLLYSAGVDMLTAQKLLGHSDIKVTMGIYTHLEDQKRQISISALNDYISDTF